MYLALTFTNGPERGESIAVPFGTRHSIGRSSKASTKIRDSHLSRVHFEVDYRAERAIARDLGSRNGVFVNGQRVDERPLVPGDRLLAGEQVWDVRYVADLAELDEEGEETVSFLDQPKSCACCGRSITLATFADGAVPEKDGQYLCPDCATVISFDSNEFQGYEVIERLGAGSAGLVFKARQLVLDRIVALKVLRQRKNRSKRTEARFLREAATISRLEHPNIVRIYDASPFPQGYFLVMEYFRAVDLQALLERRGPPSVAVGVSIGLQICRALEYAAKESIVHRDVKPANILYRAEDGVAKLSDFGLAKQIGVSAGTRDGEGIGTPCYMPPEQLNNAKGVDARADLYSLGASLYHLLSGRYPIVANNLQEFVQHVMERDPPPIERFNPRIPPEVRDVIGVAMQKKPRKRFQTAREFHDALEGVRRKLGYPPPPPLE